MLFEFILSFPWNFHTHTRCILIIPAPLPDFPHILLTTSCLPFFSFFITLRVELTLLVSTGSELPCRARVVYWRPHPSTFPPVVLRQGWVCLHKTLCHPHLTLFSQARLVVVHECISLVYVQKILFCMSIPLTPGSYNLSKPSSAM